MVEVWKEDMGSKFTKEVEEAWRIIFQFISVCLMDGYEMAVSEHKAGTASLGVTKNGDSGMPPVTS